GVEGGEVEPPTRRKAGGGDDPENVSPVRSGGHEARFYAQILGGNFGDCYHGWVARSRIRVWLIIFFIPILLVLGGLGYLAWRQSVPAGRVEFHPVPKFIGART